MGLILHKRLDPCSSMRPQPHWLGLKQQLSTDTQFGIYIGGHVKTNGLTYGEVFKLSRLDTDRG